MCVLKWVGIVVVALVVLASGGVFYAEAAATKYFQQHFAVDAEDIPIPLPLTGAEIDALRRERAAKMQGQPLIAPADAKEAPSADPLVGVDLHAIGQERAIARGKRYLESRAGCRDCHGDDFGGKVIFDNPAMGHWVAPNITRGGVTKDYSGKDWVRILRHGVNHDGTISSMPSQDFAWFSDQEIADIATYIQSLPKVDRVMEPTKFGPVFSVLILKGEIPASAFVIDHTLQRPKYPPAVAPTLELGQHLARTCNGCHGKALSGGPIRGGDPSWPPAKNITFDVSGLAQWSLDDFKKALREGVRPDGSKVMAPMPIAYTSKLQDPEVESLYLFLPTTTKRRWARCCGASAWAQC
jgi:mono/diheme cytochrome c family protein